MLGRTHGCILSIAGRPKRKFRFRMKCIFLLGFVVAGFSFRTVAAQEPKPYAPPPYRLIQVIADSTLLGEINVAAGSGYRLASVAPASGGTSVAVLERADGPEATYAYVMFTGKGDAVLQQQLNDSGAKGFRLVSRDIVGDLWDRSHPRSAVVWMEKVAGPLRKFDYEVIAFGPKMAMKASLNPKLWADTNPLDYVKPEIQRATDRGYRLVWVLSGVALIMERAEAAGNGDSTQAASTPPPFRSLKNLKGAKLQRELQKAGADSYCIIDIDPMPIPMWPAILLEKNAIPPSDGDPEKCGYEVLDKPETGEKDLNEAGARGFRLVPQSLSSIQSDQNQHWKFNAILERGRGPARTYHYRVVSAPQLPALSENIARAHEEGFRVVLVHSLDVADGNPILSESRNVGAPKDSMVVFLEKSEPADNK